MINLQTKGKCARQFRERRLEGRQLDHVWGKKSINIMVCVFLNCHTFWFQSATFQIEINNVVQPVLFSVFI